MPADRAKLLELLMADFVTIAALRVDLDSFTERLESAEWDGTAWYGNDEQQRLTAFAQRAIAANETLIGGYYKAMAAK